MDLQQLVQMSLVHSLMPHYTRETGGADTGHTYAAG